MMNHRTVRLMSVLKSKLALLFLLLLSIGLLLYTLNTVISVQDATEITSDMLARDDDIISQSAQNNESECITVDQIPKLLCWIMTIDSDEGHKKSTACLETWGKRCDKVLLVQNGTRLREQDGVLTVPIEHESRDHLWHKVRSTFSYLYDHHLNEYDWFMKADDDTYVIVEQLKEFLMKHQDTEPIYFGHKFKPFVEQGYMSGGSGYVLSREALKLLVERGFEEKTAGCRQTDTEMEDIEIGKCLEAVGVQAGDTRDAKGRPTFLPLSLMRLLSDTKTDEILSWYIKYQFYGPPKPGKDCCSDKSISFHYINPRTMHLIDWLLYDLKRSNPSDRLCSD